VPKCLFDEAPLPPRISEVIDGLRRQESAAFDTPDPLGRQQQELRLSIFVLDHREATGAALVEIDRNAWRLERAMLLPLRHALAIHDAPQHIRIGRRGGNSREKRDA